MDLLLHSNLKPYFLPCLLFALFILMLHSNLTCFTDLYCFVENNVIYNNVNVNVNKVFYYYSIILCAFVLFFEALIWS